MQGRAALPTVSSSAEGPDQKHLCEASPGEISHLVCTLEERILCFVGLLPFDVCIDLVIYSLLVFVGYNLREKFHIFHIYCIK